MSNFIQLGKLIVQTTCLGVNPKSSFLCHELLYWFTGLWVEFGLVTVLWSSAGELLVVCLRPHCWWLESPPLCSIFSLLCFGFLVLCCPFFFSPLVVLVVLQPSVLLMLASSPLFVWCFVALSHGLDNPL